MGKIFPKIWGNMWPIYFLFFHFVKIFTHNQKKKNIKKMPSIMGAHFSQVSRG
jgi:hypothetical protein